MVQSAWIGDSLRVTVILIDCWVLKQVVEDFSHVADVVVVVVVVEQLQPVEVPLDY